MKRIIYPGVVLAAGLLVSQAVFFFLVLHSNVQLHDKLLALASAGYLIVPNAHVLPELTRIPAAFFGALFFTFTIGAGLSIVSLFAAWLYRRVFRGSIRFVVFLAVAWAVLIAAVNMGGFSLAGTVSIAVIPPFVFVFAVRQMPLNARPQGRLVAALQIVAVIVVALAWLPKTDRDVFIEIRDNLLLTNTVGKAFNDFYYSYTLYPAKLIKTPGQKLMAPVCTGGIRDENLKRRIEDTLVGYDYLPVAQNSPCDLYIDQETESLALSNRKNAVIQTSTAAFFDSPGKVLGEFSENTDTQSYFRMIIFYSLFSALPLSLFLLVHAFFAALLFIVSPVFLRHAMASMLCMLIGVGAALPLYASPDHKMASPDDIRAGLISDDWRHQRSALRAIGEASAEPVRYHRLHAHDHLARSPYVPVRYWYASALGDSRHPEAVNILIRMLDDPHPNVACTAYFGLGRSGGRQAIDEIKRRITESDHWYVQWYAYMSLRRLGWTQKK